MLTLAMRHSHRLGSCNCRAPITFFLIHDLRASKAMVVKARMANANYSQTSTLKSLPAPQRSEKLLCLEYVTCSDPDCYPCWSCSPAVPAAGAERSILEVVSVR